MWIVTYERHFLNRFYKSQMLRTTFRPTAEFFYWWWRFCYLMTECPVKLISMHWEQNGVVYLGDRRGSSERFAELAKLKRFRKYGKTTN